MSVQRRLVELGGIATYRELVAVEGRAALTHAVESGEIARLARGRFALPEVDAAAREAHARSGVLSHASAALAWGWAVKTLPDKPHVTLPVKRKVRSSADVHLHRRDLLPEEVCEGRTCQELTLEQCLRSMPFDEALAVADSALRDGFSAQRFAAMARDASGPGAAMIRRVAAAADDRSANPFESVLRAICSEVPGLSVRPQVRIGAARVDLADENLQIVLEADSFAWHGDRGALRRDAQRYNRLAVADWLVLRFAWEDVMFAAQDVHLTVVSAVRSAQRRSNRREVGSG